MVQHQRSERLWGTKTIAKLKRNPALFLRSALASCDFLFEPLYIIVGLPGIERSIAKDVYNIRFAQSLSH